MANRALIIHALFDILGGGELFALRLAQALIEQGFDVEILTATPVDQVKLREIYGDIKLPRVKVRRVKETEYLSRLFPGRLVRLRRLIIYRKYLSFIEKARREFDIVFDTQSNLPTPADISYIHFPALLPTKRGGLYWTIYNHLVNALAWKLKIPRSGRVLVNSTWTAHIVYLVYGVVPEVLYPPVDVEYFSEAASSESRDRLIITISRFTPEKELDKILDIAKNTPDYHFIIAGSTGPGSEKELSLLKAKKERLGLFNVEFKPSLPRHELRRLLSEAMFYLHPPFIEHFGIAVIEAMSAGLVPIVYKDGGVWYDIVSKVSNILGYNRVEDVLRIIRTLEGDRNFYFELRKKSIEVSKIFNYENFKENLMEKIEYILRIKKLA